MGTKMSPAGRHKKKKQKNLDSFSFFYDATDWKWYSVSQHTQLGIDRAVDNVMIKVSYCVCRIEPSWCNISCEMSSSPYRLVRHISLGTARRDIRLIGWQGKSILQTASCSTSPSSILNITFSLWGAGGCAAVTQRTTEVNKMIIGSALIISAIGSNSKRRKE